MSSQVAAQAAATARANGRAPGGAGSAPARVVVGIHDGHNASVAVVRNGRVELALQEERLTRVKNQGDAPGRALAQALEMVRGGGPGAAENQPEPRFALNGRYMNYHQWERHTVVRDYQRSATLAARLKQRFKNTFLDRAYQRRLAGARAAHLDRVGAPAARQVTVEHHTAHAAAAYYTAPWREGKVLVLTCDGAGDRLSATVSIGEAGRLTRIAQVGEHDSLGRLYALITRYLGMLPLEHEYKVMGLAPYAGLSRGSQQVARLLGELFEFPAGAGSNPMAWRRRRGVPSMYCAYGFLERLLAGQRFDWIAGGAQSFMETMLTGWVERAIRETGIRRIACAGGVFMNVKANLAILELDPVEDMYVMPSAGDESNSIGAACWAAAQAGDRIEPLGGLYFGRPITDTEASAALEEAARGGARIRFEWDPGIEGSTARKLAEGKIVARAAGPVEFGARALGNRSILARADRPSTVRVINEAIKNRDFWMPFAPSVLAGRSGDYCLKPKPVASPHMMFAFASRPEKRAAFAAAQHPYDFTSRPQEVTAEHNPAYHRLLSEFEQQTGEGILLNTSFNLHGEPIVDRARDAVDVFLRSGLEHLALAGFRVEKTA